MLSDGFVIFNPAWTEGKFCFKIRSLCVAHTGLNSSPSCFSLLGAGITGVTERDWASDETFNEKGFLTLCYRQQNSGSDWLRLVEG